MAITNFNFPRVTVSQQFTGVDTGIDAALPVCVIGPQYRVKTYALLALQLLLGSFGQAYTDVGYPGMLASGKIDTKTVQVLIKDAQVRIFDSSFVSATTEFSLFTDGLGKTWQNKLICNTAAGTPIVFAAGNGHTRAVQVATNIQAGDTITLSYQTLSALVVSALYVIAAVESYNGTSSVLVLVQPLPLGASKCTGSICRTMDVIAPAVNATSTTLSFPLAYSIGITNSLGIPAKATIWDTTTQETIEIDKFMIVSGRCYVLYSERAYTFSKTIGSIAAGQYSAEACRDIFGDCGNRNPLGQAVLAACQTAGSSIVYFIGVSEDTVLAYSYAMDLVGTNDAIYSCVILSLNPLIIKKCHAYAVTQSLALIPNCKIIWAGISNPDAVQLINTLEYTKLSQEGVSDTITFALAGILAANDVKAGDSVQWQMSVDDFGNPVLVTYPIVSVAADSVVIDYTGKLDTLQGAVSIVRSGYTTLELQNHIIKCKSVADRRAAFVYADDIVFNGEVVPNYIGAACAAGMRAKLLPHRPLSNMSYSAFSVRLTHGLTLDTLKVLGSNGIWLIGNNSYGVAINRKQVTSAAADDINMDLQSLTTNIDSIIASVKTVGVDLVGNSNISPALLAKLSADIEYILDVYTTISSDIYVGTQLLSALLISIAQSPVLLDAIYADILLLPPKPFNRLHISIRVI